MIQNQDISNILQEKPSVENIITEENVLYKDSNSEYSDTNSDDASSEKSTGENNSILDELYVESNKNYIF